MRYLFAIIIALIGNQAKVAAQQVKIEFNPKWNEHTIHLGDYYPLNNSIDSIKFDVVKYYITNIRLSKQGKDVYSDLCLHYLMDLSTGNVININIPANISYDSLHFNIGTDSIANTSGAMRGDLDPMHGMYWAWQSGYINVKMEGVSSVCKTRKNTFQYHLGGYLGEHKTQQKLSFYGTKNQFKINILLSEIVSDDDLLNIPEVMSPGVLAVKLMQQFKNSFKLAK
jgi:hypothetical protein